MVAWARPRGVGRLDDCVHHVLARAALGAGDFTAAFEHASAVSGPGILEGHNPQALWCALDLVDAALHSGRAAEADAHVAAMRAVDLGRLSPRFALVTAAAEAMVASDDEAPHLFEDALTLPARTRGRSSSPACAWHTGSGCDGCVAPARHGPSSSPPVTGSTGWARHRGRGERRPSCARRDRRAGWAAATVRQP